MLFWEGREGVGVRGGGEGGISLCVNISSVDTLSLLSVKTKRKEKRQK